MSIDIDVVVVGSGPAGVSAAWPLVEAGRRVLMVDAGGATTPPPIERPPLAQVRGRTDAWRHLLGARLQSLRAMPDMSPKLRTAAEPALARDYCEHNCIATSGFTAIGALARGGLSNIWGAGASAFDAADMKGWPITPTDLAPSYRAIAARIGMSGSNDDDMSAIHGRALTLDPPLALGPQADTLLRRYALRRSDVSIRLGRARNAVLTRERVKRSACTLDNFCMWGCSRRAIYNAAYDVEQLLERPNFRMQERTVVQGLRREHGLWRLDLLDTATHQRGTIAAPVVILAAGTLPTTRLVLALLGRFDRPVRVHSTPALALAFTMPDQLGRALPDRGFSLGQLTLTAPLPGIDDYSLATVFSGDGVSAGEIAAAMPLSRPAALGLTRLLLPTLLFCLLYLPSRYSANTARLIPGDDGRPRLAVAGGVITGIKSALDGAVRTISRDFRRLGALRLPGIKTYPPGAEAHYGGTLPMGEATSAAGEVVGAPNLFIADGSVLPSLPAKHHTFTIMANADRIGRHVRG